MKPNLEDVKSTLVKTQFPVSVIVETIAYCNLRCCMCPQPALKRARGEMDFEIFRKIADEIALENPNTDLWLALMGEPLMLSNRLLAIIAYAKRKGVKKVHLNTN